MMFRRQKTATNSKAASHVSNTWARGIYTITTVSRWQPSIHYSTKSGKCSQSPLLFWSCHWIMNLADNSDVTVKVIVVKYKMTTLYLLILLDISVEFHHHHHMAFWVKANRCALWGEGGSEFDHQNWISSSLSQSQCLCQIRGEVQVVMHQLSQRLCFLLLNCAKQIEMDQFQNQYQKCLWYWWKSETMPM